MIKTKEYESRHLMDSPLNLSQCSIPQLISHGIRYSLFSHSMGNRLMTMYAPGLHDKIFMLKAECGKLIDYYESCKIDISILDHRRIVETLKNTFPTEFTINSEFEFGNDQVNSLVTWIYELPSIQYEKIIQKMDSQTGFQWKSFTNSIYQEKTQPVDWFRKKFRKPLSQRGNVDIPQLKQVLTSKKYNLGRDFGTQRNLMEKLNKFHKQKQKEYFSDTNNDAQNIDQQGKEPHDADTTDSFFSSCSYREFDQLIEEQNLGERFRYAKNGRKMLKIDFTQYMVKDMIYGQEEELNDLVNNLIAEKMLEQMSGTRRDAKTRREGESQMLSGVGITPSEILPDDDSKVNKDIQKKKSSKKTLAADSKKQSETVKRQPDQTQIIPPLQPILQEQHENNPNQTTESKKNIPISENSEMSPQNIKKQQLNLKQKSQTKFEQSHESQEKTGEKKKKKKKKNKHKKLQGFQENQKFTLEPQEDWKNNTQNKDKPKEKPESTTKDESNQKPKSQINESKSQALDTSKQVGNKKSAEQITNQKKPSRHSSKDKQKNSIKYESQDEEEQYAPSTSRRGKGSLKRQDNFYEDNYAPVQGKKTTRSSRILATKQEQTSYEQSPGEKHVKDQVVGVSATRSKVKITHNSLESIESTKTVNKKQKNEENKQKEGTKQAEKSIKQKDIQKPYLQEILVQSQKQEKKSLKEVSRCKGEQQDKKQRIKSKSKKKAHDIEEGEIILKEKKKKKKSKKSANSEDEDEEWNA